MDDCPQAVVCHCVQESRQRASLGHREGWGYAQCGRGLADATFTGTQQSQLTDQSTSPPVATTLTGSGSQGADSLDSRLEAALMVAEDT